MNQPDCKNKTAFCVMRFQDAKRQLDELVWCSADFAAPEKILTQDGKTELTHIDPHRDEFKPHLVPRVGTRIFLAPAEAGGEPKLVKVTAEISARFNKETKGRT